MEAHRPGDPTFDIGARKTQSLPNRINNNFTGNDVLKADDIIIIPKQPIIYEHVVWNSMCKNVLVGLIVCQLLRLDETPQYFYLYPESLRMLIRKSPRHTRAQYESLVSINGIPAKQWFQDRLNNGNDIVSLLEGKVLKVVARSQQEGYVYVGTRESESKIVLPALSFDLLEGFELDKQLKIYKENNLELTKIQERVHSIKTKYNLGFDIFIKTHKIDSQTLPKLDCEKIIQGENIIKNYHNAIKAEEITQKYPLGVKIIFNNQYLDLHNEFIINQIISLESKIRDTQLQIEETERQNIREQKYIKSPYRDLILKSMDHVEKDHYSKCTIVEVRRGIGNCPDVIIFGKNLDDLIYNICHDVYAYRTLTHSEQLFVLEYKQGTSKGDLLRKIIDCINKYCGE